jgi:hypothetical protein
LAPNRTGIACMNISISGAMECRHGPPTTKPYSVLPMPHCVRDFFFRWASRIEQRFLLGAQCVLCIVDGESACIKAFEHEKKKKNSKSSCKIRLGPESNGHHLHECLGTSSWSADADLPLPSRTQSLTNLILCKTFLLAGIENSTAILGVRSVQ